MASNQRTVISGGDVDQLILYLKVIVIQAMINFHQSGSLRRHWGEVACGWAARQFASDRPNPAGMRQAPRRPFDNAGANNKNKRTTREKGSAQISYMRWRQ